MQIKTNCNMCKKDHSRNSLLWYQISGNPHLSSVPNCSWCWIGI